MEGMTQTGTVRLTVDSGGDTASSLTGVCDKEVASTPCVCLWASGWHKCPHSIETQFLLSSPPHARSHLATHVMAIIVFIVCILIHFLGN